MGLAGLIFEPYPSIFENQYNFWRCSNDFQMISQLVSDFQRSLWECSVHICSCPWLRADLNIKVCHSIIKRCSIYVLSKLSLFEILETRAFHSITILKFVCFEKATKIWKNLPNCFKKLRFGFFTNFMAYSEYISFTTPGLPRALWATVCISKIHICFWKNCVKGPSFWSWTFMRYSFMLC